MSRAERRAYKRMTKSQDPYAPPGGSGARARVQRQRTRRPQPTGPFQFVTGRFLVWSLGGAIAAGLVGFSIAWPNGMPVAAYAGLGAAAVWGLLVVGVRFMQQRIATQRR
ncbi:MAG TPA: hypothetical protein VES36_02325 [Candidatus Limnocylindrales bacterium]|nr:hypothetical protein [Candidatus Limnocylindrales bacterium]